MGRPTRAQAAAKKAAEAEKWQALLAAFAEQKRRRLEAEAALKKAAWWEKTVRGRVRAAKERQVREAARQKAASEELAQLLRDQDLTGKAASDAALARMRKGYAMTYQERQLLGLVKRRE